jgi:hypothetical protein
VFRWAGETHLAFIPPSLAGLLLGATTLITLVSGTARAQSAGEPARPEAAAQAERAPVSWELSAGTRFPLELGIEGALETQFGLTAHLGIGFMPRLYRDAINEAAVGFGWYDDLDAAVVAAALEDAFLISPTLGWRPPALRALELYAGYVVAFAGGTVTTAEVEDVSGEDLPDAVVAQSVPLGATAHAFQLGVAFQIPLQTHLALRLSLAYFQIFASSTSIDVTAPSAQAQRVVDRVEVAVDDYVGDLLTTYVKSPLFGLALVWRF